MELTLNNYTSALPKELLKQAKKNIVRECDETEKGHFVAYVDEGNDTYDVSLTISPKAEITAYTCDCKSQNNFCKHKAALVMHIAGNINGKKTEKPVKIKQRKSKADALLEETDEKALKAWVKELLAKNNDIEMAFIHYFNASAQLYGRGDITRITMDAVKAVVKNRIKVETAELKKIIDLWTNIHVPVIQQYQQNVADENTFFNFHELIETCLGLNLKANTNSNKILQYCKDKLQNSLEYLNNLFDESVWAKAVGLFIAHIPNGKNHARLHYVGHLKNLITISNEARRLKLIDLLVMQYHHLSTKTNYIDFAYTELIFSLPDEYKLFYKYLTVFNPVSYQHKYNLRLIGLLIENKQWELAEVNCKNQLSTNGRDQYDGLYLDSLRLIYKVTNNEKSLLPVLEKLFPFLFNFDDFMFVYERIANDDERKKWRYKMLEKAKRANSRKAEDFCFQLADHERKYKTMFEYLRNCSYQNILKYFQHLAATDSRMFLTTLLDKQDDYHYFSEDNPQNTDKEIFPQLYASILSIYNPKNLMDAIQKAENNRWAFNRNRFISYMKKQLQGNSTQ